MASSCVAKSKSNWRVVFTSKYLEIVQEGVEARKTMRFADGSELEVDSTAFSTGIRPRDKLVNRMLDVARVGVSSLMICADF